MHTCDQRQPLHSNKISMLNCHDTSCSKELLGVVIDQLPDGVQKTFSVNNNF